MHSLPLDHPRGDIKSHQGAVVTGTLNAETAVALESVARHYHLSPFMLLHAVRWHWYWQDTATALIS